LPFQNKPHPARGPHGEVNPKAIEEVNIIFAAREIAAQKTFEPCAKQSTEPFCGEIDADIKVLFEAGPGWNARTGWGSPNGRDLLTAFRTLGEA
jgi:hypothetical protein